MGRSLRDLVHRGEALALKLVKRDPMPGTPEEVKMVFAWADGLTGKRVAEMGCRGSLQDLLDFDVELASRQVAAEVATMERLLGARGDA